MLKNIKEIKDFVTESKLNEAKPKKPGEWAKEYSHLESKDIYQKGDQVVYVRDKGGPWESKQTDTGVIRKVKRGLYVGMNAYVLTDGDEIYQNEILGLSESIVNEVTLNEYSDISMKVSDMIKAFEPWEIADMFYMNDKEATADEILAVWNKNKSKKAIISTDNTGEGGQQFKHTFSLGKDEFRTDTAVPWEDWEGMKFRILENRLNEDIESMEIGLKQATGFPVSVSKRDPEYRAKWSYIKGELPNNKWKAAIKYIEEDLNGVIDSKRSDNYYEESWERGEPAEAVPTIYFTK